MSKWEQTVRKVLCWTISAGLILGLIFLLTYRYCEQVGQEARSGCAAAGLAALIGTIAAFWPLGRFWNQKSEGMMVWIFLSGAIRLLTGFVGVVIILLFTQISRAWFLGCYGFFYLVFLAVDSWLMICLLHHHNLKEDEPGYE